MPNLDELIAGDLPHITDIRHDLHAHPELGYQEQRTSSVVQRELKDAGVKFVEGLAGGTGVLAVPTRDSECGWCADRRPTSGHGRAADP